MFGDMGFDGVTVVGVVLICVVLPALLSLAFNEVMRRLGWVKTGDMQLEL